MAMHKFGRYEIKTEIARGGMATVFHAYDPRFERDVAIKVLPREFLHDPQFRTRFDREAKTIASLEHPAIVPVYDFGEEEGQPFIVMRYMSGGDLSDRIAKGPVPVTEATQILTRLAPALDAAHAKGIIHRDLKPGNILFDQYGNAFLSDFGIARLSAAGTTTLTGGAVLGTPSYMSPEQIQGDREIDGRSDIYALGVILFQMLTGNTPYKADTPARVMMMHLLEPVPNILKTKADLPPTLESVVKQAMAKEPTQRFATAAEMATALETSTKPDAGATRIAMGQETLVHPAAGPTMVTPTTPVPPGVQSLQAAPGVGPTVLTPVAVPKAKRKFPVWGYALIGLLVLSLVGGLAFGGISLLGGIGLLRTATPLPQATETPKEVTLVDVTPTRPPVLNNTPILTNTTVPTRIPTATPPPVSKNTPAPPPSNTPKPLPSVTVVGGADKIAFVNANNIWLSNLDGSNLVQLTTDGGVKSALNWDPNGQTIYYIVGKCVQSVEISTTRVDLVTCFESAEFVDAFEISPTRKYVAISLNHEPFIVTFNLEKIKSIHSKSGLQALADCQNFAPIPNIFTTVLHWSLDEKLLSAVFFGVGGGGKRLQEIEVMNVSNCGAGAYRVDEFPASRFTISGYDKSPIIQTFGWGSQGLFALTGYIRNDGYGDLYFYNSVLHKAEQKNPIEGVCCYRDPSWSPDGSWLALAFQDIRQGPDSVAKLYYIQYGTIGTGKQYQPLSLPENFFTNRTEKPQPILRPAVP